MEAYQAAGGDILRDLWGQDSSTFLTNQPLLTKLALDALQQAAEPVKAEGWRWVETSLDASVTYGGGFGRIYPTTRQLTDGEQAELAALEEAFHALREQIEAYGEGDPAMEADAAQLAEIDRCMQAIQKLTKVYDPQERALSGCMVYLDQYGAVQFGRGYVKTEDRDALDQLQRGAAGETAEDDEDQAPALSAPEPDAGYSVVLVEELTAIRTAALRVELANRPAIALAALLYPLVGRIFLSSYVTIDAAVEVSGQRRNLVPSIKEPGEAPALAAWQKMQEAWGDVLPGQPADLWVWLLEQPTDKLLELLAFVTAANLNGVKAKHDHSKERLANADQIAIVVGLDMTAYWTANATFLARLSKAGIAEVLDEAGYAVQQVRAIEKSPKAEAVEEAEKLLAGKGWLPPMLRASEHAA